MTGIDFGDFTQGVIVNDIKERLENLNLDYVKITLGADEDNKNPKLRKVVYNEDSKVALLRLQRELEQKGYDVQVGCDITNNHNHNNPLRRLENTVYEITVRKKQK